MEEMPAAAMPMPVAVAVVQVRREIMETIVIKVVTVVLVQTQA
jgi:hypothetical protein